MSREKKTFARDEVVQIRTNSQTTAWREGRYQGEATIHFGHRPWHSVAIGEALYDVPINRIRKVPK